MPPFGQFMSAGWPKIVSYCNGFRMKEEINFLMEYTNYIRDLLYWFVLFWMLNLSNLNVVGTFMKRNRISIERAAYFITPGYI